MYGTVPQSVHKQYEDILNRKYRGVYVIRNEEYINMCIGIIRAMAVSAFPRF